MGVQADVPSWKRYIAEFLGTFLLVLAGAGAVVVDRVTDGGLSPLGIAAVFGVALAMIIYALGHISGAHLNPAVTLAFSVSRDFPLRHIPGYVIAQSAGALLAAAVLALLYGPVADLGATTPQASIGAAFAAEFVFAFVLMFVIESVATDTRAIGSMAGLAGGVALFLAVLLAGPLSGGSVNPARSLGPSIVSGAWDAHWIYWMAPILGAIAGALSYRAIRSPAETPAARAAARVEELPAPPSAPQPRRA